MTTTLLLLVLLAPALGAAVLLLGGRRTNAWGPLAAIGVMGAATAGALALFGAMLTRPAAERPVGVLLYEWLAVGDLRVPFGLYLDQLSMSFVLLITIVGTLIHVYSLGYMAHDPDRRLFFGYLNLFVAAMLLLVLADNYLLLYVGWEGVGLASYLLIGFYRRRASAATAAKKAFLINRVGDFGLSVAIMVMFTMIGAVTFSAVDAGIVAMPGWVPLVLGLLLLLAAAGKSAQFPLQAWLFDAMEGPTPVSALIHAATMVTAGVFLMTRVGPVVAASYEWVPTTIAVIGAATALFAATIAVAQNDIKRVLAYSTVSQLGFMFLAIGSGAYVAAIFHMVTHAFFKALLFLGSGSVIHGMHHEQDMRRMGALRAVMPVTAGTFIIGWLAIAGVPPFAGFWSKDEILLYVYANNRFLYAVGMVTALLTAFYMTRQVILVFFGKARWNDAHAEHGAHGDFVPHESPRIMLFPLVVLAALSVVGGALQLPFSKSLHFLEHWLEPVIEGSERSISGTWAYDNKYLLLVVAIVVVATGIGLALLTYAKGRLKVIEPAILEQAWRYDTGVARIVGGPGAAFFRAITTFDARIVDGAVNATASLVRGVSSPLRKAQSGYVRAYALIVGIGAVLVVAWFVLRAVMGGA